jgi:hypothetical protein
MSEQVEQVITAQRFTVLKGGWFTFNPGSMIYPFIASKPLTMRIDLHINRPHPMHPFILSGPH